MAKRTSAASVRLRPQNPFDLVKPQPFLGAPLSEMTTLEIRSLPVVSVARTRISE